MRALLMCLAAAVLLLPSAAGAQSADASMEKCVGDWEAYAEGLKRGRQQADRRRQEGGEPGRAEKKEQQNLAELAARFLPACGKYGFEAPSEPRAEVRNNTLAKDLRRKTGSKPAAR